MVLRLSCPQLHYGLCVESDKRVFDRALQVAADIEHWAKSKDTQAEGRAFRITDAAKPPVNKFVFVCHNRPRKLTLQTTVVLAKMHCRYASDNLLEF